MVRLFVALVLLRALHLFEADPIVGSVAVGGVAAAFAQAELHPTRFVEGKSHRLEASSDVRPIAERLALRPAAGAPVMLARLELNALTPTVHNTCFGGFLDGFRHIYFYPNPARDVPPFVVAVTRGDAHAMFTES